MIPFIPNKRVIVNKVLKGKFDENFLKERMNNLENFCKEIISKPYLYYSEEY
jgi:hypothetical protein